MAPGKAPVSSGLPTFRQRRVAVINTLALVGSLCLVIVAQFILFPLLFTYIVDHPHFLSSSYGHQSSSHTLSISNSLAGFSPPSSNSDTTSQKRVPKQRPPPDGTFNGAPLYLKTTSKLHSLAHCVGENYRPEAWKYRSCRFHMLCFNTTNREFITYQTSNERLLSVFLAQRVHMHSSTTLMRFGSNRSNSVSIGGINQKWGEAGIARLEWFPQIRFQDHLEDLTYYELPKDIVLVPFHSLNGANPGHLVWDDFLPIYTLLDMFQLLPSSSNNYQSREVLPLRFVLNDGQKGLWASCDLRAEKTQQCQRMMQKFKPLLMGSNSPYNLTSTQDFQFQPSSETSGKSDLVCAKTAVAGFGALTDHGVVKSHGWDEYDYMLSHNHGRGGLLYDFRNFMMDNLGVSSQTKVPPHGPHRIVFSQKSSDILVRNLDFQHQIDVVRKGFPREQVENYVFKELSVNEQIDIASRTSIYITLCGGGAVTAMFLPRGASVIVFYSEDSGFDTLTGKPTGKPALLDWDLLNSMSHLRVHWMPRNTMGATVDERALLLLIQHELDIMGLEAFA